jgi:hypothetical protein
MRLFGWLARHPLHSGVIVGLLVAVAFGLFSFPREEEIQKTITDWRPGDASEDQRTIDSLISSLQRAGEGEAELRRVSEDEFRELDLDRTHAAVESRDDEGFVIQYIGQEGRETDTVYLAERTVSAGPWWHPDRLLYRAVRAETDRFSDGLRLTFERDWQGLAGLLMMDAIVGAVYGTIIGLILAVVGARELSVPGGPSRGRLPPAASMKAARDSGLRAPPLPDHRRRTRGASSESG